MGGVVDAEPEAGVAVAEVTPEPRVSSPWGGVALVEAPVVMDTGTTGGVVALGGADVPDADADVVEGGGVLGAAEVAVEVPEAPGGAVPAGEADKPGKVGAVETGTLPGTFGKLFAFLYVTLVISA